MQQLTRRVFRALSLGEPAAPMRGLCGLDHLFSAQDFPKLARDAIEAAQESLEKVIDPATAEEDPMKVVEYLDSASNSLCKVADVAEFIRSMGNPQYAAQASESVRLVTEFMENANLSNDLYLALKRTRETVDWEDLSQEDRLVLDKMLDAMENEGKNLDAQAKQECLEYLQQELYFSQVVTGGQEGQAGPPIEPAYARFFQAEDEDWKEFLGGVEGLGQDGEALRLDPSKFMSHPVLQHFAQKNAIVLPLSLNHDTFDFLKNLCVHQPTRQLLFRLSRQTCRTSDYSLGKLREIRYKIANFRGFSTWNEFSVRNYCVRHKTTFLRQLFEGIQPPLLRELGDLHQANGELLLAPGDIGFAREKVGSQSEEATIDLNQILQGVQKLAKSVFNVAFIKVEPDPTEIWHEGILKFMLVQPAEVEAELSEFEEEDDSIPEDAEPEVLGVLYMDLFARAGKTGNSAQFTLRGSKLMDEDERQTPYTALVCSLNSETLSLYQATTFLHEVGHCFHSLLSKTKYQHLSGTRGVVDFVEFPSHLFEFFVLDSEACQETFGIQASPVKDPCRYYDVGQQIIYSVVDDFFYESPEVTLAERLREFSEEAPLLKEVHYNPCRLGSEEGHHAGILNAYAYLETHKRWTPETTGSPSLFALLNPPVLSRFEHLVHYGGGYHCYLSCKALAAHVWERSFKGRCLDHRPDLRELLEAGSTDQSLARILDLAYEPATAEVPVGAFLANLKD